VVLVDREGRILAREGDRIAMGAKGGDDGVTYACDPPEIRVIDAEDE
jgi:hypothetical protein